MKAAGIDDDPARDLPRLVNPIDDFVFAVALMEAQFEPELVRQGAAVPLHVGERFVAVDVRLPLAEQVQVGAVEDENEPRRRDGRRPGRVRGLSHDGFPPGALWLLAN